jgi:hypothetical protein
MFAGRGLRSVGQTDSVGVEAEEGFVETDGVESRQKQNLTGFIAQMVNGQIFARVPATFQRGGETMLSDNQISIKRPFPGGPQGSLSSILVATLDDCQFADNQFEADIDRAFVLLDAVLLGVTVRAIGNRGQEGALCWRSIVAFALGAANISHNQTTVPIEVGGTSAFEFHNQSAI